MQFTPKKNLLGFLGGKQEVKVHMWTVPQTGEGSRSREAAGGTSFPAISLAWKHSNDGLARTPQVLLECPEVSVTARPLR